DDSEAEGRLLSGGGVVDLNSIAALNPAYSADPSATGVAQNPLSLDVLNALDIDLGDGVQLFGENGVVGVGALAQYARTNPGEAPFASSGAVNADGTIAFAPTDPNQNAFLDLGPLLDAAGLAELLSVARLALGALSASATLDEDGNPLRAYQVADGTLVLQSPAVAALSDGVYDVLGDVSDPLNDLVGEGGAIDSALQPLLGGLSELVDGLLTVVGGSLSPLSVSATLDLDLQAAVDSVLSQPLTSDDSAVTLDLSTGEILVDLSMLVRDSQGGPFEGTLNGLDPNTEVLGPHVVQAALDGAIGSIFDQIPALLVNAVTDALHAADLEIGIPGAVTGPLGVPIGALQVNIGGTLGDFLGVEGSTPPTVDLDGTSVAGLPLGTLLTPVVNLVVGDLLPALVTPVSEAITDVGTLDTIFRPAVELTAALLDPLAELITENLVSVTVNVQELPGAFTTPTAGTEDVFTQRAVQVALLPGATPLAEVSIASATVRAVPEQE